MTRRKRNGCATIQLRLRKREMWKIHAPLMKSTKAGHLYTIIRFLTSLVFKNGEFFIHPIAGAFEMHRSIRALNSKKRTGKSRNSDDESTEDDEDKDTTAQNVASSSAVRVKFSRPETERQKKRREASALHREKKIASDLWIPMKVHLKENIPVTQKMGLISYNGANIDNSLNEPEQLHIRDLVNKAIICGIKEELVIESGKEHMLSKQRIDELSAPELRLKAYIVKSHVMKTSEMRRLIDERLMSTEEMISQLKQCARLVNGVWVLDSNLLFQNLPPAHSNTAGKTDLYRAELWRNARDLALCLIDGGHRVTRLTLITCFKLSSKDAEEILSTFGVRCETSRSWKLRIEKDDMFIKDPQMQKHIIAEKERWIQAFSELEKSFHSIRSPKIK
uniref:Transcriptional protein SWT1 n=1 Tax=Caenorhabditis tropicalis TaxID=1561998 RepID=A0A1I7UJP5_9PELO